MSGLGPAVVSELALRDQLAAGRLVEVATEIDLVRPLRAVWQRIPAARSRERPGRDSPRELTDRRYSALTALRSLLMVSLASPKSSEVFSSKRSSFSIPANPGRIERFMKITALASSTFRIGIP
jgi:hypothetical protein